MRKIYLNTLLIAGFGVVASAHAQQSLALSLASLKQVMTFSSTIVPDVTVQKARVMARRRRCSILALAI